MLRHTLAGVFLRVLSRVPLLEHENCLWKLLVLLLLSGDPTLHAFSFGLTAGSRHEEAVDVVDVHMLHVCKVLFSLGSPETSTNVILRITIEHGYTCTLPTSPALPCLLCSHIILYYRNGLKCVNNKSVRNKRTDQRIIQRQLATL